MRSSADSRRRAAALDARDPLASFRDRFFLPPTGHVYLDGNSLGLLSREAEAAVLRTLDEWKRLGIEGWTAARPPWFFLAEELARLVAPLVGAAAESVIVTNSTTVNLHQLLATLYRPHGGRTRILSDELAFPSDTYALTSHLALRGLDPGTHLLRVASRDGYVLEEDDLIAAMDDSVHTAILPGVIYTSGQWLDVPRLTRAARERGILIGWDLSHSIGSVPHALDEWDADFAFWCTYKYLNGGPGATGGLYLNRRHFGRAPGLAGWFGSDKSRQFEMSPHLSPASGASALQIGTPNILSMAALDGSLRVFHEAGLDRLREKSMALTEFLMDLADARLAAHGFAIVTPREKHRRGGHVALAHLEAARICKALRQSGVVPDFRPPNIVRLAPVALYSTFAGCVAAVDAIEHIMQSKSYQSVDLTRELVT